MIKDEVLGPRLRAIIPIAALAAQGNQDRLKPALTAGLVSCPLIS